MRARRGEHRERVGPAREEDGDEDALGRGRLRSRGRDALLERLRPEAGRAVDRQRQPGRARDERAPGQAGAGRQRHARLDRRQAHAGLGGGAPQELGA